MFNSRLMAVLSDTPWMSAITPLIQAMAAETSGQVSIALGKDEHFTKWGRHYIPSFVRANVLEQCNIFKDKSVAAYGADFFQKQCEHGEAVFLKIPPPEPKTRGPALVVNGMCVVRHIWGHGLEDNDVVPHPFFGSLVQRQRSPLRCRRAGSTPPV